MKLSSAKRAVLALIVANIIWGASAPIFKWSLEGIPMYTLAFFRFVIPTLLILVFTNRKRLKIRRGDYRKIFYMSYFLITMNILFTFLGLLRTISVNVSIIVSSGPIFLMLFSYLMLKEKIKKKIFLGNAIGFVGVLIIVFQPLFEGTQQAALLGNLFLVASMFGIIFGTILAKEIVKSYHPITLAFWAFLIGSFTFLPFFIMELLNSQFHPLVTMHGIGGILFGSFMSSLMAYFLFFWALKYFPASEAGVFAYIDPLASILIAIPLLHENLSSTFYIGSFLIFFGIYVAENRFHYHPIHRFFRKNAK